MSEEVTQATIVVRLSRKILIEYIFSSVTFRRLSASSGVMNSNQNQATDDQCDEMHPSYIATVGYIANLQRHSNAILQDADRPHAQRPGSSNFDQEAPLYAHLAHTVVSLQPYLNTIYTPPIPWDIEHLTIASIHALITSLRPTIRAIINCHITTLVLAPMMPEELSFDVHPAMVASIRDAIMRRFVEVFEPLYQARYATGPDGPGDREFVRVVIVEIPQLVEERVGEELMERLKQDLGNTDKYHNMNWDSFKYSR
ncbi:hypothetical protein EJ05DRAFT_525550 [Pseudovirgaria hyperparasitica]|uniref:Uncharacterized protein n=1 Tax=Pseudovirgaria hyperparasitica TaxID=470096 RepID=A0A6A6WEL3_9PEZI|nr:uncharacterized protein EJ05DRAFT_525550 [Pseudovirgaria hyperparasitica]KAF2760430.1 hypothetical protein EJ05DRAFT_525550 [Pseudovirgaria hyperparasitica]